MPGVYSLCLLVDLWRPLIIGRGFGLFGRFRPAHVGALLTGTLLAVASFTAAQAADSQKCRELFLKEDYVNAHDLCRDLAAAGDSEAQVVMGYLLAFADGVERDMATAAQLWHQAYTRRGDEPPAPIPGLRKKYVRQLGELLEAAAGGETDAQFLLGTMVDYGVMFPRKRDAAAKWYGRAAERGHVRAQIALAVLHDRRYITNADPVLAAYWYRRAALAQAYGDAAQQFMLSPPLPRPKPAGIAPPAVESPRRARTVTAAPRRTDSPDDTPRPTLEASEEQSGREPGAGPSPEDQLRTALDASVAESSAAPQLAAEEAPRATGAGQSDDPLPEGLAKRDDETLTQYRTRLGSMSNEELLKLLGIR